MTDDYEKQYVEQRDRAVTALMKLDAEGCRMIVTMARMMQAFDDWSPENVEQIPAFRDILDILTYPNGDSGYIADELLPLAKARASYQEKVEQEEAERRRYAKRFRERRRREIAAQQARLETIGLHLILPKPDDRDPA